MFDIGGWEFLVIVVVAIVVIGPKDLPAAIKTVASWTARARELAREFRAGLDELQREVELDKLQAEVRNSIGADEIEKTAQSIRSEIDAAGREIELSADPRQLADEAWNETHARFQDQPDMAHGDVEQEALRRLAEAEAAEREEAAARTADSAQTARGERDGASPLPPPARGGAGG